MKNILNTSEISDIVIKQLSHYWFDIDCDIILKSIPEALDETIQCFSDLPNKRFHNSGNIVISPYISLQWMCFLYRLSRRVFLNYGAVKEADQIYYLNKIMHSIEWFYEVDLPIHFLCEHPLGSVLGKAVYDDYLFVYQGTTIGGNYSKKGLVYPHIGKNVLLYANATVLGESYIGSNVVISANTYIINQRIPDNSLVFGKSPDLVIKQKSEDEILKYTEHIWGWSKISNPRETSKKGAL